MEQWSQSALLIQIQLVSLFQANKITIQKLRREFVKSQIVKILGKLYVINKWVVVNLDGDHVNENFVMNILSNQQGVIVYPKQIARLVMEKPFVKDAFFNFSFSLFFVELVMEFGFILDH
tara:strand:+ start:489 stop:848 length:360 start_codon:yes stop_codon:yes gene_type:complete